MELTHLSLFTGIGCSDLAAEWAGFETVLMCEIDPDCQKVLRKHWPEVPIIGDIRDVTSKSVTAYTTGIRCEGSPEREYRESAQEGRMQKSESNDTAVIADPESFQSIKRECGIMAETAQGRECRNSSACSGNQSNSAVQPN